MTEAAALLGVSNATMWRLVKDGTLSARQDPLDRRVKLIERADLDRLAARSSRPRRHFVSDGAGSNPEGPDAATVKGWIRANWHRER